METSQSKSLSPAAQAVMDAYRKDWTDEHLNQDVKCLAAALRAVADQVVPNEDHPRQSQFWDEEADREWQNHQHFRRKLLAIAAELEGSMTYNPPEDNEMEETQWTMLVN
jgi:hypothetical protein